MSFFGDVLGFEQFHLGDLWDRIKDDPKRLILGVDPLSTGVWNKVLGKDDEPLVNLFGGPTSDVYERAQAQGIDTGPGKTMHDIATVIAGSMAGGYGMSKLPVGNMGGSGSGFDFGNFNPSNLFGGGGGGSQQQAPPLRSVRRQQLLAQILRDPPPETPPFPGQRGFV